MNDEKKDIGTDFDEELSQLVHKKSRKRVKKNIYERFISRVQSVQSADSDSADVEGNTDSTSLESANKLPAFEPLSAKELQLFEDKDSDEDQASERLDIATTNATFDFSNPHTSDQSHETLIDAPLSQGDRRANDIPLDSGLNRDLYKNLDNLDHSDSHLDNNEDDKSASIHPTQESLASSAPIDNALDAKPLSVELSQKPQKTLTSSKKPLIVGIIFGALLIALIVLTLIFTGVLSTSVSNNPVSEGSGVTAVATNSTPVVGTQPIESSEDDQPADDTNNNANIAEELSVSTPQDNQNTIEQDTVSPPVDSAPEATPETEAAITYEDFRQESQTTLYRETND